MTNQIRDFGDKAINALYTLAPTKKTETKTETESPTESPLELKFESSEKPASSEGMQQGTAAAAASKSTNLQRLAARLNPTGAGKAMLSLAEKIDNPVKTPNAFRLLFATKSAQKEYAATVEKEADRLNTESPNTGAWKLLAAAARYYKSI